MSIAPNSLSTYCWALSVSGSAHSQLAPKMMQQKREICSMLFPYLSSFK
ncbi:hypothetical protein JCM19233_2304 [Vibrio astriarenae]|nr:hypothetical protein JCM19233_2304 [Vibrio sp. C7]